jgi:hypothetical protein
VRTQIPLIIHQRTPLGIVFRTWLTGNQLQTTLLAGSWLAFGGQTTGAYVDLHMRFSHIRFLIQP